MGSRKGGIKVKDGSLEGRWRRGLPMIVSGILNALDWEQVFIYKERKREKLEELKDRAVRSSVWIFIPPILYKIMF